jgi:mannose-6-phosphate isomerase-like protein (cupin superfamily)
MNAQTVKTLPLVGDGSKEYRVNDSDTRPWGYYIVTAAGRTPEGEEFCEKEIMVKPWNALSLQSHEKRRETWTVKKGTLTVLVDGCRIVAGPGEKIEVPRNSIHCMANLSNEECLVHELQAGECREDDIQRYADAYNRATAVPDPAAAPSVALYNDILADIRSCRDAR